MRSFALITAVLVTVACVQTGRLKTIREERLLATVSLPEEKPSAPAAATGPLKSYESIFEGDSPDYNLGARAEIDENGEIVAYDNIKPAVISARFRNVAERGGKVDISFDVTVPKEMISREWMLEFTPILHKGGGCNALEAIRITGSGYRKEQLRGYEHYNRFLSSIITDSMDLLDRHQLEVFIRRNIPSIYKFRQDSSIVSESEFTSAFGVSEKEAVRHYTLGYLVRRNNRKIAIKEKMKAKYIKMPIEKPGLRTDTVLRDFDKDIVLNYIQSIKTVPGLKKVSISLKGRIFHEDKVLYDMPECPKLDFYISSLSSLAEPRLRFVKKVIERRVEENTVCYIDFAAGSSTVDVCRERNGSEIARIKANLSRLARNTVFDLDSIVVTASCSPEGSYGLNRKLALDRAGAVGIYFNNYLREVSDSLRNEEGFEVDENGRMKRKNSMTSTVKFSSASIPENWRLLDLLVERDSLIGDKGKMDYRRAAAETDPDKRELLLSEQPSYKRLREWLYPQLRVVEFSFHMHRKGMIKDTVHTTEPDSVYARGLEAIKALDYKTAVSLLRPYNDYNSAVACCALEYNASALEILRRLKESDKVCYLMAIVLSRLEQREKAVEFYLKACRLNPAFISRGNLDPEISELIKNPYSQQKIKPNLPL